jgi:hypothetical protein
VVRCLVDSVVAGRLVAELVERSADRLVVTAGALLCRWFDGSACFANGFFSPGGDAGLGADELDTTCLDGKGPVVAGPRISF